MQDFVLLVCMLASFVFGWFLVGKLDAFLDENQRVQEEQFEQLCNEQSSCKRF